MVSLWNSGIRFVKLPRKSKLFKIKHFKSLETFPSAQIDSQLTHIYIFRRVGRRRMFEYGFEAKESEIEAVRRFSSRVKHTHAFYPIVMKLPFETIDENRTRFCVIRERERKMKIFRVSYFIY